MPGWTDEDRAWALGLALREAQQCPRGHYLPESSNDDWRWIADEPLICLACSAQHSAMERQKDSSVRSSQLFSVHKVPRPKPKRR